MFSGSMVALATPMFDGVSPETAVDWGDLEKLIEFHIDNDTDAIVAVGTTGESATLDEEEHTQVISRVVELVNGRKPVIAGTGANSTMEALSLTRAAKEAGADACLLVSPYYNKPTQEGMYLHHQVLAETVDIPQILYNVPGRTAVDLLPETVGRLARFDNIIGIKEATADLDRVAKLRELCGDDFLLITGDDATSMEFMLRGGCGVISVTANVAPKLMHDMCMAAIQGDRATAEKLNSKLDGLHDRLFIESNPIPAKWALHRMGLIKRGIRLPMTWLSPSCEAAMEDAMRQADVITD